MVFLKRSIAVLLVAGVLLVHGLHRHAAHDGGFSSPHVDCVLCAWSQNFSAPALAAGAVALAVALLAARLLFLGGTRRDVLLSFPFLSRAPPLR